MIICVELFYDGHIHEECNSGMIRLIAQHTDDEIYVVAGSEHIAALKEMGIPQKVHFIPVIVPHFLLGEKKENEELYFCLLHETVRQLGVTAGDKIFVMYSSKAITMAMLRIADLYKTSSFFIEHSNLECLLREETEQGTYTYKNIINKVGKSKSAYIISFSPYANELLKDIISPEANKKLYFINHPVDGTPLKHEQKAENCSVIGVYGACVNSNFHSVLKRMYKNRNYIFQVLRKTSLEGLDATYMFPNNVELHQKVNIFSFDEQKKYLERMDWILLPYSQSTYHIRMSGILADAIHFERPVIALKFPIIDWYNRKRTIGIVEPTIERLVERLERDRIEEQYEYYVNNIRQLKRDMDIENNILMRKILDL